VQDKMHEQAFSGKSTPTGEVAWAIEWQMWGKAGLCSF